MKATLTINDRGVVTLPAKLRQAMGLKPNDQLIAETTAEGLLLRPTVTLPVEIYSPAREAEFSRAESELAEYFVKQAAPGKPRAKATHAIKPGQAAKKRR